MHTTIPLCNAVETHADELLYAVNVLLCFTGTSCLFSLRYCQADPVTELLRPSFDSKSRSASSHALPPYHFTPSDTRSRTGREWQCLLKGPGT